ncbi:hypothetical protein OCU04_004490 [Sclerotinia nivalis]|uniref:Uncharacterized protein n=1 Tax=Sclerotinia nivalis TaxID=352851 RepID=A0A9X0AQI4_9HELO|nr:hypothetical protein OCU04_004490 [Sclerotinia nivalis]
MEKMAAIPLEKFVKFQADVANNMLPLTVILCEPLLHAIKDAWNAAGSDEVPDRPIVCSI